MRFLKGTWIIYLFCVLMSVGIFTQNYFLMLSVHQEISNPGDDKFSAPVFSFHLNGRNDERTSFENTLKNEQENLRRFLPDVFLFATKVYTIQNLSQFLQFTQFSDYFPLHIRQSFLIFPFHFFW